MIAMRNRNKMEPLSGNNSSTTIEKLSIVVTTILFFFKPGFQTKNSCTTCSDTGLEIKVT